MDIEFLNAGGNFIDLRLCLTSFFVASPAFNQIVVGARFLNLCTSLFDILGASAFDEHFEVLSARARLRFRSQHGRLGASNQLG